MHLLYKQRKAIKPKQNGVLKMTDKEYLQELNNRIDAQSELINRYTSANAFAPDFYYEELYQMCNERIQLMRKMKMENK